MLRTSRSLLLTSLVLLAFGSVASTDAAARQPGWRVPPAENPRFTVFDMPDEEIEARLGVSPEEIRARRAAVPREARGDTGIVCVLLCQWMNHPADTLLHPPEAYETLLFSEDEVSPGSMREYFLETSYGSYFMTGDVWGWLTQPDYAEDLWFTDFFAAADPFIDFSRYDRDGDGYTDAVWVFHAGPGQEETHDYDDIWSYALYGLDYMTDDGVIIDRYSCNPEEHGDGTIITIRVAAHEATHVLGLPDLYDYDAKLDTTTYYTPGDRNDHPLVDWCLMGYGGYNIMSYGTRQDPSHHCAWSKWKLGFVDPIPLATSTHRVRVPEVETHPVIYRITGPGAGSQECFLVENRNTMSETARFDHLDSDFSAYFDWFTPGQNQKDPGLLILHVDDAVASNTSGPSNPHYKVIVEDAGYNPARPWDGVSEFSEWWYPYEFRIGATWAAEDSQTAFTPLSSPNSNWYGGPSDIWITNISRSGPVMTFDLGFGNAWPAITAHSPVSLDTTLTPGVPTLFSVTAMDPNGDSLSYEWTAFGGVPQGSNDPVFWYETPEHGAVDTVRVVVSDGELADSLGWVIRYGTVSVDGPIPIVADHPRLSVSPMPFWGAVTLTCEIPRTGETRVAVYDMGGHLVAVVAEGRMPKGTASWIWDGTRGNGLHITQGVYLARIEGAGFSAASLLVFIPHGS